MRQKVKTTATRSAIMRAVRSKHTGPELVLRHLLSRMGYRYRLHNSFLPGKPDVSFSAKKKVIFLHGCFWHQHSRCKKSSFPKSNLSYWTPKLRSNVERDQRVRRALRKLGWEVLVVWQCGLRNEKATRIRLKQFLGSPSSRAKRSASNMTSS
jgi:DNA mismatch endonuclease (patch repair protein)